jgi:hypothetical protein
MIPLMIDAAVRADIQRCVAFAKAHPVSSAEIAAICDGMVPAAGNMKSRVVEIPLGYRCVFSIDQIDPPIQGKEWARHLSVSVTTAPLRVVNPPAFGLLMQEFGFEHDLSFAVSAGLVSEEKLMGSDTLASVAMNVFEFCDYPVAD